MLITLPKRWQFTYKLQKSCSILDLDDDLDDCPEGESPEIFTSTPRLQESSHKSGGLEYRARVCNGKGHFGKPTSSSLFSFADYRQ